MEERLNNHQFLFLYKERAFEHELNFWKSCYVLRQHIKYFSFGKMYLQNKNVKIKYLEKFISKDATQVIIEVYYLALYWLPQKFNKSSHGSLVPKYELKWPWANTSEVLP